MSSGYFFYHIRPGFQFLNMNFMLNLILFLRLSISLEACHFYKIKNVNVIDFTTCRTTVFPTESVTECILRCSQDSQLIGSLQSNFCYCLERQCIQNKTAGDVESSNEREKRMNIFEKFENAMKITSVKDKGKVCFAFSGYLYVIVVDAKVALIIFQQMPFKKCFRVLRKLYSRAHNTLL